MLGLLELPRNHPRIKKQIQKVQRQICDITSKLIFCCGSSQQPLDEYLQKLSSSNLIQ